MQRNLIKDVNCGLDYFKYDSNEENVGDDVCFNWRDCALGYCEHANDIFKMSCNLLKGLEAANINPGSRPFYPSCRIAFSKKTRFYGREYVTTGKEKIIVANNSTRPFAFGVPISKLRAGENRQCD